MEKRIREDEPVEPKYKKIKIEPANENRPFEDVCNARDLQRLLAFRQDAITEGIQNIHHFREFLETIARDKNTKASLYRRKILLEYMNAAAFGEDDRVSTALPDIMETWTSAAQANHDDLLLEIPRVLSLVLRAISADFNFRLPGLQLCRTLLRKEQVQLISRGLSASKPKASQVSYCLGLLTEIITFDGGTLARELYDQRQHIFKHLNTFLVVPESRKATREPNQRTSIRECAIRFLLVNFRFQNTFAKCDLASNTRIVRVLFQYIRDDSPEIVKDILKTMRDCVLLDDKITPTIKSRLLTESTLRSISTLYSYDAGPQHDADAPGIKDLCHEFLNFVCTTLNKGVLVEQQGWYPPGTLLKKGWPPAPRNSNDRRHAETQYKERVPVKNTTLAAFLQALRPYRDLRERDLTIAIFDAAPELIADYFLRRKFFSFEPKLTSTWIGYASFLFSVVRLRIPKLSQAWTDLPGPPPTIIVLESILPQPFNKINTTRCLNQSHDLVRFLVINILIAAFRKFDAVLIIFRSSKYPDWQKAARSLLEQFCERCPEIKHVIAVFRSCHSRSPFLREAASNLISLYYTLTPQIAVQQRFDISMALTINLDSEGPRKYMTYHASMQNLQLVHLLEVARRSPSMRWWHKSESMLLSPFTQTLRSLVSCQYEKNGNTQALLQSVVMEHSILQQETARSSCSALCESLREDRGWKATDSIYQFFDGCVLRFVRKSIKYFGQMIAVEKSLGRSLTDCRRTFSLLSLVIAEQWPFLLKRNDFAEIGAVGEWIGRYLGQLHEIGEDLTILQMIRDMLLSNTTQPAVRMQLESCLNASREESCSLLEIDTLGEGNQDSAGWAKSARPELSMERYLNQALRPPIESEDHPELNSWRQKDITEAIQDGDVGKLICCLCSQYYEIRCQALLGLKVFMSKLLCLDRPEWQQIYVLVGEVIESASLVIAKQPAPWILGALAANGILVLSDPLHVMYPKLNKFLNRSPSWNISRIPAYWMERTLLQPPERDEDHYREVDWLLALLIEGLRSPADVDLYRQCGVFERILAIAASPMLSSACALQILHLLYRCTFASGSTTLVTRCGSLGWIRSKIAQKNENQELLKFVGYQILQTCEKNRVFRWTTQDIGRLIEDSRTL